MKIKVIFLTICTLFVYGCGRNSAIDYDIASNDSTQAIVLLKSNVDKRQLNIIADSCFNNTVKKLHYSYSVWFYYGRNWKGKMYYAGKLWQYNIINDKYFEQNLDITGIKYQDN